ncbi:MAG: FG-GAP repeat protein [Saprospiraceae bacterium]|nr:FG-GAP repeat protein [Saprospiraceae bacterium]
MIQPFHQLAPFVLMLDTRDFEGYDGHNWISFTPNPGVSFWPAYGNRGAAGSYNPFSPDDAAQGDEFGFAVDIDGIYAVVGSPGRNGNNGRVLILKRDPIFGFWNPIDTLDGSNGERFGHAVAISGNDIIVGAPKYKVYINPVDVEVGKLYLFKRSGSQLNLISSHINGGCYSSLGHSVDIQDGQWAAGAINESFPPCSNQQNNGAVLVSDTYNAPYWVTSPNVSPSGINKFGFDVSLYNNWLVVGAPFSQSTINEDIVYIFKKPLGGLYNIHQTIEAYLFDDEKGYSVSIYDNKLLIGTRKEDKIGPGGNSGTAEMYLYRPDSDSWSGHLNISGGDHQGLFGHTVSSGDNYEFISAKSSAFDISVYMVITKNIGGSHNTYLDVTDPAATVLDYEVNDVATKGNYFIVGLPTGISLNDQVGGRIFIGKIR